MEDIQEPNPNDLQPVMNPGFCGTSPVVMSPSDYDLPQSSLNLLKPELKVNSVFLELCCAVTVFNLHVST